MFISLCVSDFKLMNLNNFFCCHIFSEDEQLSHSKMGPHWIFHTFVETLGKCNKVMIENYGQL